MKGKHTQAAAVRHEVQSRDAEIATYQRRVAKLTAELREAREQIRAEDQRHRRVERELLARLDHAAAPKVEALEILVATRTKERDASRRELDGLVRKWNKAFTRLSEHFRHAHGMDGPEIGEAVLPIMFHEDGGEDRAVIVGGENIEGHIGPNATVEQVRAIQIARGDRPRRPRRTA